MNKIVFICLICLSAGVVQAESDACQRAKDTATAVEQDQQSSAEGKLSALLAVFPSHSCIAANYRLQLAILQHGFPDKREGALKHFKKAVQQANKQPSVLRAEALAWFARATWEAVQPDWSQTTQERERATAYKEARNAKRIYNQQYPGQEPVWFDDYLLDMGEQLKNPSALAIAAQLDMQSVSRDAIATAAAGSVEMRINFEQNSDQLTAAGEAAIGRLLAAVDQVQQGQGPNMRLQLIGHTSTEGGEAHNLELSNRRAEAVKRAVLAQRPQLAQSVSASGQGESQPIYPHEQRELMRAANRRVEIRLSGS